MKKQLGIFVSAVLGLGLVLTACGTQEKPSSIAKFVDSNCACCIEDQIKPGRFIAMLATKSNKMKTMKIKVNSYEELIKFDAKTKVEGAQGVAQIDNKSCIIVDAVKQGDSYMATAVKLLKPVIERVRDLVVETPYMQQKLGTLPPKLVNTLLVDSRPANAFFQGSIPGAVNIPYPKLKNAKDVSKLLGADKKKEIIFFCGGEHCNLAPGSAVVAKKAGYTNVKLYHAGFPGWQKAGNIAVIQAKGLAAMVKKRLPMIIIDVRPLAVASKEHIPNAVPISVAQLANFKAKFPVLSKEEPWNTMAPIVLYNDTFSCGKPETGKELDQMTRMILGWGYRNVSVLDGGLDSYKKIKGELSANSLRSTILYERKLAPGEVSAQDFVAAFHSLKSDEIILDARSSSEFGGDHVPGALNMDASTIDKGSLGQLDKYRNVYVYCNTGVLAEIAYTKLTKLGKQNVKFLNDKIQYEPEKITVGTFKKYEIQRKKAAEGTTKKKAGKVEGC